MILYTVVSPEKAETYLPPILAAMIAHLLPNSSCNLNSSVSSFSDQLSFIMSGFK